jgi:tetratricopeptide (TPR) repeat protein
MKIYFNTFEKKSPMKHKIIYQSLVIIIVLAVFGLGCKTHKKAVTSYTNGTTIDTTQDYLKIGNELLDKKKYKEAIAQLDKAIAVDADNGEAYAYRGTAKYHLKDYKGAIADFDIAIKLIPDYGEVYDLRGVAKGELGDKVGACEDWNKAFELGFNKAFELIDKFCIEDKK